MYPKWPNQEMKPRRNEREIQSKHLWLEDKWLFDVCPSWHIAAKYIHASSVDEIEKTNQKTGRRHRRRQTKTPIRGERQPVKPITETQPQFQLCCTSVVTRHMKNQNKATLHTLFGIEKKTIILSPIVEPAQTEWLVCRTSPCVSLCVFVWCACTA